MSDRRWHLLAGAILLIAPLRARAQEAAEWRARLQAQSAITGAASKAYREMNAISNLFDGTVRAGALRISFNAGELSDADTAAIAEGLRAGTDQLRARYGDAGAALAKGAWTAERNPSRLFLNIRLSNTDGSRASEWITSPVTPAEVERFVIGQAGDRFTRQTPALFAYSGWSVFHYDRERDTELSRRLATSWAASGRRCAAGSLDACAAVLSPFDTATAIAMHFEPRDYRTVIGSGQLPSLSDSAYFVARRECLRDGVDSSCARIIHRVRAPDPYNASVRGSLLAHAVELGGIGAVARASERPEANSLALIVHISGVPRDSLLSSWHRRTFSALDEHRRRTEFPLFLTSVAWSGLLLLAAFRRKFL